MEQKTSKKERGDPFAGCVITEMVRRGERRRYSYSQNGLPEVSVKSAPAWSPLIDAAKRHYAEQESAARDGEQS